MIARGGSRLLGVFLLASCATAHDVALERPAHGQVVYLQNGSIFGTLGSEKACAAARQVSITAGAATLARALDLPTDQARSQMEHAMSGCTPARLAPASVASANMWVAVIRRGREVAFLGAPTEDRCTDLLRDDDQAKAAHASCRPMLVDRW